MSQQSDKLDNIDLMRVLHISDNTQYIRRKCTLVKKI